MIQDRVTTNVVRTVNVLKTADHPYIGPVGTSGNYPAHMHVDMGFNTNKNPLTYIPLTHTSGTNFTLGLWDKNNKARADSWAVKADEPDSYFLNVAVTSTETLNLDEVKIYIDDVDEKKLIRRLSFGGRPKADGSADLPVNTDVGISQYCSAGSTQGVYSVDKDNNGESETGYERFIFTKWGGDKSEVVDEGMRPDKLSAGEYELIIKVINVKGEEKGELRKYFTIIPQEYVLFRSRVLGTPSPGATGTPTPSLDMVTICNQNQEPRDEETPATGLVPTPTPAETITTVNIKDYLKGVFNGAMGGAAVSDSKCKANNLRGFQDFQAYKRSL